ncbi:MULTISPECIES: DUF6009 family protein [unclassified Streptomyces]|uniref:DUF6009 family protein n=1 Tax=unclassified Streptomyces TaxID=2593676 RepID=UPI000DBA18FC|nr:MULTISPECIES: DUF6009 family protein [unclassified Streptomyces]MYT69671.1 transcription factor [Streptomyces sp. SID8367]RAJ70743.1 hypothetical protein K377_07819 [Streptomyces sp. PsTaAH-137]
MSSLLADTDVIGESKIVWLEDIAGLESVRQAVHGTPYRKGKPNFGGLGRLVGYAELAPSVERDPHTSLFHRRVFYLVPHDRDSEPDGDYRTGSPGEAVDPQTVDMGQIGEKTERSQRRAITPAGA